MAFESTISRQILPAEQTDDMEIRMTLEQPNFPRSAELTFSRFKELPIELRYEIWKLAISSRIVHIYERPIREPSPPAHTLLLPGQSSLQKQHLQDRGELDWETAVRLARERAEHQGQSSSWSDPTLWLWKRSSEGSSASLQSISPPLPCDNEEHRLRIEVEEPEHDGRPRRKRIRGTWGIESDMQIPGVLLACRESFKICSRSYGRSFATKGTWAQTYFNSELDTLLLSEESAASRLDPEPVGNTAANRLSKLTKHLGTAGQLHSVQYLALAMRRTWHGMESWLVRVLSHFPRLETLILVVDDRPEGDGKPWKSKRMSDVILQVPNSLSTKLSISVIDERQLERHRANQLAHGCPCWKLPTIEMRHLVNLGAS